MQQRPSEPLAEALGSRRYAFVDAGCGDGGSTSHLLRRFGRAPGLGLDSQQECVDATQAKGFDALLCDLLQPDLLLPEDCVDYAAALDVLEHLPQRQAAALVLARLARAAREFLFIRHPSFEDVEYLAGLGLKLNWTDWSGHRNRMRLSDFRELFAQNGWRDFVILPHMLYADSAHASMLPLSAPEDTIKYDPRAHGPKPEVSFDRPLYGKYDIFVRLGRFERAAWDSLASVDGWEAQWDL